MISKYIDRSRCEKGTSRLVRRMFLRREEQNLAKIMTIEYLDMFHSSKG